MTVQHGVQRAVLYVLHVVHHPRTMYRGSRSGAISTWFTTSPRLVDMDATSPFWCICTFFNMITIKITPITPHLTAHNLPPLATPLPLSVDTFRSKSAHRHVDHHHPPCHTTSFNAKKCTCIFRDAMCTTPLKVNFTQGRLVHHPQAHHPQTPHPVPYNL